MRSRTRTGDLFVGGCALGSLGKVRARCSERAAGVTLPWLLTHPGTSQELTAFLFLLRKMKRWIGWESFEEYVLFSAAEPFLQRKAHLEVQQGKQMSHRFLSGCWGRAQNQPFTPIPEKPGYSVCELQNTQTRWSEAPAPHPHQLPHPPRLCAQRYGTRCIWRLLFARNYWLLKAILSLTPCPKGKASSGLTYFERLNACCCFYCIIKIPYTRLTLLNLEQGRKIFVLIFN